MQSLEADAETASTFRHRPDVETCMNLIERGIAHIKDETLVKYQRLLRDVQHKIGENLAPRMQTEMFRSPSVPSRTINERRHSLEQSVTSDLDALLFPNNGPGSDNYLDQVSSFFDDSFIGVDEMLADWYGSVASELQPHCEVHETLA